MGQRTYIIRMSNCNAFEAALCVLYGWTCVSNSDECSDVSMNVPQRQQIFDRIRIEWWALVLCVVVPPIVLLASLYLIGQPQDFEVWQYAPPSLSTIALIESMRLPLSDAVWTMPDTNHWTALTTWVFVHLLPRTQYVFMALYVSASIITAVVTYGVGRVMQLHRTWALLLALSFALLPARFWFTDIATHWWLSMPLIWSVIYGWWYQPADNRIVRGRHIVLLCIPWLGWEQLIWSIVALSLAAVIAAVIRSDWQWRQLLAAAIYPVAMMGIVQTLYPIPFSITTDAGIRLLEMVVPHQTHVVPWLASLGMRLSLLEITQTPTVYAGALAVIGMAMVVWHAIQQILARDSNTAQPMFVWMLVLLLLGGFHGVSLLGTWIGIDVPHSQSLQLFLVFGGLVTLFQWLQHHPKYQRYAVGLIALILIFDQIPTTNLMYQMRQSPHDIVTKSMVDGIWFGQQALPKDVTSVSGLSSIEPGYGRWSDAAIAESIQVRLRAPIRTTTMLEIRARGVGANVGAPITVRIGDESHTIVLDSIVRPYVVTFTQPRGTMIEIVPQPVPAPPPGESRRIGVFLQSIRVIP